MTLMPRTPQPFDAAAVEALSFRQRSVGVVIADADPDPNVIRTLRLRTPLGEWDVTRTDSDTWEVAGEPVGPGVARECDMVLAFHAADATDLRDLQGPEAAERYSR